MAMGALRTAADSCKWSYADDCHRLVVKTGINCPDCGEECEGLTGELAVGSLSTEEVAELAAQHRARIAEELERHASHPSVIHRGAHLKFLKQDE
jgi:hypothetical protein